MLTLPHPLENNTTDAIVVPTGGPGRIDRGIALLKAHQARRMLVTGVAPGVRPIDLARTYRTSPSLFSCCIDLGGEAVDTRPMPRRRRTGCVSMAIARCGSSPPTGICRARRWS